MHNKPTFDKKVEKLEKHLKNQHLKKTQTNLKTIKISTFEK